MTQHAKKLFIFIMQPLLLALVLAPNASQALSSDRHQTAHLSAKYVRYDRLHHLSLFKGDVIFRQGTTTFHAQKVIIHDRATNNKITKLIAYGKRAEYSTIPDGKKHPIHAKANTIIYLPIKGLAMLKGNSEVTEEQNVFRGPEITYNIKQQTVTSAATNKEKTTIILQP